MVRMPSELPVEVRGRAFSIHERADLTRARLRASDLWIPARGTRLPQSLTDLRDRCAAHGLTLPPGAVFSGVTAARLYGLPLPPCAQALEDLDVTVPRGARAPRRRGVVSHQRELPPGDVSTRSGLAVTAPARTFLDLASVLPLTALVAVGDRLIARRTPIIARELLDARVAGSSARGSRRARDALALLDDGSESPKETELRLLVTAAGFGPFEANFTVRDGHGRFVARLDLALVRHRIALEYEGDHHRERNQWRRDLARRRRLEALGWLYLPVTQADLDDPRPLLADLRTACSRR